MAASAPKFDADKNILTIPEVEHVVYTISGKPVSGQVEISQNTTVRVRAAQGYVLAKSVEREHHFEVNRKVDPPKPDSDQDLKGAPEADDVTPAVTAGSTPQSPGQDAAQASARAGTNNPRP